MPGIPGNGGGAPPAAPGAPGAPGGGKGKPPGGGGNGRPLGGMGMPLGPGNGGIGGMPRPPPGGAVRVRVMSFSIGKIVRSTYEEIVREVRLAFQGMEEEHLTHVSILFLIS